MPSLTLSRKPGETIELVGTGVVIRIPHRRNAPRVRITIEAPDTIRIRRGELAPEAPDLLPDETPSPPSPPRAA